MPGKYLKNKSLSIAIGNLKIGTDTMILNMGSATNCPSMKKGLCKLGKKCYALKAEKLYPEVLPARNRQEKYWKTNNADQIFKDISFLLETKKMKVDGKLTPLKEIIQFFRYNESGDFYCQADIKKLDLIAKKLKSKYNIVTYGYTARSDLDFAKTSFIVKGSGHNNCPDGKCITRRLSKEDKKLKVYRENKESFKICPTSCKYCNLCKKGKINIVFDLH